MRKPVSGVAVTGRAPAAPRAYPAVAQAQSGFGRGSPFYRSAGFTQAGLYGNHLRSIGMSRNPWAVLGGIGGLNYLYGGGGGYGEGGGVTLDAGAVSEIMKAQSQAIQAAQKAKQDKKDRQRQGVEEQQPEQAPKPQPAQQWEYQKHPTPNLSKP